MVLPSRLALVADNLVGYLLHTFNGQLAGDFVDVLLYNEFDDITVADCLCQDGHRIYPFVLFSQHDAAVGLDGDLGAPLLIHLQCGLGGLSLLIIHKVVQRLACHHG